MVLILILAALLAAPSAAPSPYDAWRPLLARELAVQDLRDARDLYKFVYQGTMGPQHAGADSASLRPWLDREWAALPAEAVTTTPRPPLLAPLRPDGALVRVDLVRARGLADDPRGVLAAAQARTAAAWGADTTALVDLWTQVVADTALWAGRLDPDSLAAFTRATADAGWPAVHHSAAYAARWQPHYRVVAPSFLPPGWAP